MSTDQISGDAGLPVGAALKRLRRRARLTGRQLGDRVGMSQAKISRIETGAGPVRPEDVRALAVALGETDDAVSRLVERAEAAEREDDRMADWRPARGAVATMQQEVADLEASTTEFRVFQPAVIVGLAQTSEYARAVLGNAQAMRTHVGTGGNAAAVPEAVSARVRRQEILAEPHRRFSFVMTESVLRHRFGRPKDMPAQIERLRDVARQDNVSMRIIPLERELSIPPYHGFELLDDRCVLVDLFNTTLTARGSADTVFYRHVFDSFEEISTDQIGPILDRYLETYLDLSRPAVGRQRQSS
jgi:transcriptional regulator with XRE-family HTH domain